MKVSEILQSNMVNDNTVLYISKPIGDTGMDIRRKGYWYTDDIASFAESKITKLTYIASENKIYLEVKEVDTNDVW